MNSASSLLKTFCGKLAIVFFLHAGLSYAHTKSFAQSRLQTLFSVHDEIVNGSRDAASKLDRHREEYTKALQLRDISEFREASKRKEAIIFVLCGGSGAILKPILLLGVANDTETKLLKGLIAHWEARPSDAETLLLGLDPLSFEPLMGGHLALTQALLTATSDPDKAFRFLDIARLLLPGTLVEEAALRHTFIIAAKHNRQEIASRAVALYFRRFTESAYAFGFRNQFIQLLARLKLAEPAAFIATLEQALNRAGFANDGEFLIAAMEHALRSGNLGLTQALAQHLMTQNLANEGVRERLALYTAAASVFSGPLQQALVRLDNINRTKLTQRDHELLDVTLDMAKRLGEEPSHNQLSQIDPSSSLAADKVQSSYTSDPSNEKRVRQFPSSHALNQARQSVIEADKILEGQ